MNAHHPRLAFAVSTALCFACGATHAAPDDQVEEVIVTAQRLREQIQAEQALTPGGVTVVDAEDLYERSVTNMTDMLRYVPGVWAESGWGSDELFFSSRGSNLDATDYDKNGVKLLQDGLPVTTADGNNHNRVLDPLSARYAVIARGANALTYGASTLGGAFDFISPTARTTEPLSMYVTGGSSGLASGRVTAGGTGNVLDGLITLEAKTYDGYRDHSKQERTGVYANAGWRMSDSVTTRFYGAYVDNNEELPRGLSRAQVAEDPEQVVPSAITGDNRKDVQTARGAIKTTWQIDQSSTFEFGLSHEDQALFHPIVDIRGPDPDGDGPLLGPQFFSLLIDTDHTTLGGMARYNAQLGDHNVVVGVHYADSNVEGGNYQNLLGQPGFLMWTSDEHAENIEAYAVDRWALNDSWTLIYGAQLVETSRDVSDGVKGDYSSVNPRLGVIYVLSDTHELFASVSKLFEPPTTFELVDEASGTAELLEPMEGVVGEIGLRGSTGESAGTRWRWDVSAYYAAIDDEILSVDDPNAPGTSLSANVDATIHAGIEALVGASFALRGDARLEPLVSLTLNDFSFDDDPVYGDNDLPAAPKYAARGEIVYRHANGFYAGPTFDFIGSRYADFLNTYKVESYELLGLRGGFAAERWEVFGELRNLLDEDYIATVSVRDVAGPGAEILFPGAPLSAYVGARVSF